MSEYIDREAVKNAIYARRDRFNGDDISDIYTSCGLTEADDIVDSIPAADVVPVRHGRWEQKEVFETKGNVDELQSAFCSVCKRFHTTPYSYYFTHYNYCPNCGADMRGEE